MSDPSDLLAQRQELLDKPEELQRCLHLDLNGLKSIYARSLTGRASW